MISVSGGVMREKRRGEVLRRVDMVMEGKFEETSVEAAAILLLFSLTSRKLAWEVL